MRVAAVATAATVLLALALAGRRSRASASIRSAFVAQFYSGATGAGAALP
jgi:hypothetical protein